MKYLIVTDVHGNLTALEAVLNTPEARACGGILSLGDQVNYGPKPRQVLERFLSLGAVMLLGNHEERLSHIAEGGFSQANWALLRWTYGQVKDILPVLPKEYAIGGVLCTHAVPGDVYKLVYEQEMTDVLDAQPGSVRMLLTGHNHMRWLIHSGGRTACNPGSVGLWEFGKGGKAPFAVLDMKDADRPEISLHSVRYDLNKVKRDYAESGALESDAMFCRAVFDVMQTGKERLMPFIRHAMRTAEAMGKPYGEKEAWFASGASWPWEDAGSIEEFWKRI